MEKYWGPGQGVNESQQEFRLNKEEFNIKEMHKICK